MSTDDTPRRGIFFRKGKYLAVLLVPIALLPTLSLSANGLALTVRYANCTTIPLVKTADPLVPAPATANRVVTTWITAYASVPELTSDHPFITASGAWVHDGTIAANFLPFGTRVKIPELFGDKIFVVEDRMNERFPYRMDIWMYTVSEAVIFGIRHAKVVVLDNLADPNLAFVQE